MKKRITAAFLIIGIGGILVIIGMMMGGSVKKAFYKSDYEEWDMDDKHTNMVQPADIHEVQLTSNDSVLKQLKADISYATLRIEPHNKQSVAYSITNNTKRVDVSVQVEGNVLTVSTKKNRNWNWFLGWHRDEIGRSKTVITVKIPQNTLFDTVDINTGAASLTLDGFTATQRFILNTGAGEVNINNITASNVNIKTGVGETVFRNCSFTDTEMHTGVGETVFDGKIFQNLEIHAGIGEIDMRINGKKDDYAIDITSGIGSVSVNGASGSGLMGNIVKENQRTALHTIEVKAGIGEVNINFTE